METLLLKVSAGDERSFGLLFNLYYGQLSGFILRITESEQLTQEIVQDVFLKIWTHRATLPSIECFNAYLMVAARNHSFNCLKRLARENIRKKEWVNAVLREAVNSLEPATDNGKLLDDAVSLLPPQQQKVYRLSRYEKIGQDEIARKLNISLETVKKHMVLALRFLKNHLRTHTSLFFILLCNFLQH